MLRTRALWCAVSQSFCDLEAIYTYEGTYEVNALVAGRGITGEGHASQAHTTL